MKWMRWLSFLKMNLKMIDSETYEYAKIFIITGTSKKAFRVDENNFDILFDIDWQGTQQLSKLKN